MAEKVKYRIKRRIIKQTIQVTKRGQQVLAEIVIPDNVHKVVGVIVTSSFRSGDPIQTTKRYFGVGVTGLTDPLTLDNSENISNKGKVFDITAGAAEYIHYFHPVRLGRPDLYIDGILGGFKQPITVSVVDPESGFTEYYYGFESQQAELGTVKVSVKW